MDVKLNDEEFSQLSCAIRTMHADGRRLDAKVKRARLEIAEAEVEAAEANARVREVLDPLAERYGFDSNVPYELNYETKSLVTKKT